jgi:hypothetical protein
MLSYRYYLLGKGMLHVSTFLGHHQAVKQKYKQVLKLC